MWGRAWLTNDSSLIINAIPISIFSVSNVILSILTTPELLLLGLEVESRGKKEQVDFITQSVSALLSLIIRYSLGSFHIFFYIHIERYVRGLIASGVKSEDSIHITPIHELCRSLILHYNRGLDMKNVAQFDQPIPESFRCENSFKMRS
ncbi:unnamed protein product [Schistocephalus solidus]|uniref:Prospero domain-containing protein n=1 Tax=Schistocephalus solidus TaxID=70667 RepID=A0A183TS13_SCHSO|nr:unnamed protein product [Schistocephalus solidus]